MQYRPLGQTGVQVSSLCLGTMAFGGDADEAESARIFHRCREAGVNHFDCADVYCGGRSEEILGRLVRPVRDEVFVATKVYFPTGADPNARGASRYHIVRALEASLRRMGTDRVDLYYLHRFDDVVPMEETLRALEDLVRAGKVLYLGASNFAAWQVAKALGVSALRGWNALCCIQPMYNLVKRQAEVELFPMAQSENLAVFPYGPLGGGLLSGKYGVDRRPKKGRLVNNPMYATRYRDASNYEIAERFTALAQELGMHPVTLAVAWVASHPAVTAPLIGGRSVEQLEPSLAAAEVTLDGETRAQISALSPTPPPATDRNEEASAHNYSAITEKQSE